MKKYEIGPELPPRHSWRSESGEVAVVAHNTEWGRQEDVIWAEQRQGTWYVMVWKLRTKMHGEWKIYATVFEREDAVSLLYALCLTGEADYALKDNETAA
jgi:hypothetical protein